MENDIGKEIPSWDEYFMTMTMLAAMRSRDTSTNIGAVLVGPNKELISTGYNSLIRGVNEQVKERHERPEKYLWFEHGERNAIYNAARIGISTLGTTMYTNGTPCANCARAVVQAGIKEVVVHRAWNSANEDQWYDEAKRSVQMFQESGVILREYDGPLINIRIYRKGQPVEFEKKNY